MPAGFDNTAQELDAWEAEQVDEASREAAAIGGRAGDEYLAPAHRPLIEAGEGVAEGFELAEERLIALAEHTGANADPLADAFAPEADGGHAVGEYGEADHEASTEVRDHR